MEERATQEEASLTGFTRELTMEGIYKLLEEVQETISTNKITSLL